MEARAASPWVLVPRGERRAARAGGDHADAVGGPHIGGVAEVLVELVAEAHAHAGGEVAEAEDEGFEVGSAGGDGSTTAP